MNISSETFGLNSSDLFFFNGTEVEVHFNVASYAIFFSTFWVVVLNSYVIWLIAKGRGNGPVGEIFSLNLSFCETVYCVESLFVLAIPFNSDSSLLAAVYFLDGIVITGRPLFQCVICVERYLAVVHPVTFLKYKALKYRVICSVVVWMACFVTSGISGTTFRLFINASYLFLFCVQFFFLLLPQLFCCVTVLRALKRSGPGDREKEEENHMKRRAFYLVLISTVCMVTIYAPYMLFLIVFILLPQKLEILSSVSYVLFALAGVVQPLLFLYRVGKLPFMKY